MYAEQATNIRKLAQERARGALEADKAAKENERFIRFYLFIDNFIA